MQAETLVEKIKSLPPERVNEVADFVDFLHNREKQHKRKERHESIAAYAAQHAGTDMDLDADLESAAIEHLLDNGDARR